MRPGGYMADAGEQVVRHYEAVDMADALRMVKSDLGPDAVILSSGKVMKGAGAFGLFGRPVIKVTAAAPAPRGRRGGGQPGKPAPRSSAMTTGAGTAVALEPVLAGMEEMKKTLSALAAGRTEGGHTAALEDEVRELKSMLTYLMERARTESDKKMGRGVAALTGILRDRGLAPEHIQSLVDEIRENMAPGPEPDLKTLLYVAASGLKKALTFGGWLEVSGEEGRRVVALAGPTGVGKTTTAAKLAANLARSGARVGLVTIDTYRIAAVEQLKIYAKILKIPLRVVLYPGDLPAVLDEFRSKDIVIIDTAGRSQRDMESIEELSSFLDKAPGTDVRLVLSAASPLRQMTEAARNFSSLGVSGLMFTKLDEAVEIGGAISLQLSTGLPASYLTTGQRVPEDVEEATAKRLLNRFFRTDRKKAN